MSSTFFTHTEHFEEEEEASLDDSLLEELEDEDLDDDLVADDEVLSPILPIDDPLEEADGEEDALFSDEEEEEDMGYDSFDDHDEL